MLVVLAKFGSPQSVGKYVFSLSIVVPILSFGTMKTRLVQATDSKQEFFFRDYLGLRIITTLIASMVVFVIIYIFDYQRETALVIIAVAIAKAFESISDIIYGLLQRNERMDRVSKSLLIRGPLALIALSLGMYVTGSVFWGTLSLAIVYAGVLFAYDTPNAAAVIRSQSEAGRAFGNVNSTHKIQRPFFDKQVLMKLAWLALPLAFVVTMDSLRTSIPRYFIIGYSGEYDLGIFATMAYLKKAGNIIIVALGLAATPRLANYYASCCSLRYRKLLLRMVAFGLLVGAGGVMVCTVAGPQIMTLLYGPEYAAFNDVLILIMLAAAIDFVATFLDYGINAARYFKVQVPLLAAVLGSAALACYWLIPTHGIRGAALAVVLSTLVRLGITLGVVIHALRTMHNASSASLKSLPERTDRVSPA